MAESFSLDFYKNPSILFINSMNTKHNPEYTSLYILTLVKFLLYTIELLTPFDNRNVIDFFCYPHPRYIMSGNNKLNFSNEKINYCRKRIVCTFECYFLVSFLHALVWIDSALKCYRYCNLLLNHFARFSLITNIVPFSYLTVTLTTHS